MAARIIDGVEMGAQIRAEVRAQVAALKVERGVIPGLAAVVVGQPPRTISYIQGKGRVAEEVGIREEVFQLAQNTPEEELIELIHSLNHNPSLHAILVDLPLPPHINERRVFQAISPQKDIDSFHPENMGRLLMGQPSIIPSTAAAIREMLTRSGHPPQGKHVVICGRSNLVGKPVAATLMQRGADATITICHTHTKGLVQHTRRADILIAAVGSPHFITADMVSEGVVIIDVGLNRIPDPTRRNGYRVLGDVDLASVREKAAAISPVPGGLGPVTLAMTLVNTVKAALNQYHSPEPTSQGRVFWDPFES